MIFAIKNGAPVEILVNPKFKMFLIVISSKPKPLSPFRFLLRNTVDVEIVLSALAFISSKKFDGWMNREHEASDIALVRQDASDWAILI